MRTYEQPFLRPDERLLYFGGNRQALGCRSQVPRGAWPKRQLREPSAGLEPKYIYDKIAKANTFRRALAKLSKMTNGVQRRRVCFCGRVWLLSFNSGRKKESKLSLRPQLGVNFGRIADSGTFVATGMFDLVPKAVFLCWTLCTAVG